MNLSRISKRKVCFIHILFSMKENHLSSQYCSSYRQKSEDVQIVHIYIWYRYTHYTITDHYYTITDHVALLWTGATDFGQDGYWTWSQSKKPVKVRKMMVFLLTVKIIIDLFLQIIVINSNFAVPWCDKCRLQFQLVPTAKLNCINSSPKSSVLVKSNQ